MAKIVRGQGSLYPCAPPLRKLTIKPTNECFAIFRTLLLQVVHVRPNGGRISDQEDTQNRKGGGIPLLSTDYRNLIENLYSFFQCQKNVCVQANLLAYRGPNASNNARLFDELEYISPAIAPF